MSSLNSSKDYEIPGDRLAGHFETTVDLEEGSLEVRSFSKSHVDISSGEQEKGEQDSQEKDETSYGTLQSRIPRDGVDTGLPMGPGIITVTEEKVVGIHM